MAQKLRAEELKEMYDLSPEDLLRETRRYLDLTQDQMGRLLNYSFGQSKISLMESGNMPVPKRVVQLCKYYLKYGVIKGGSNENNRQDH